MPRSQPHTLTRSWSHRCDYASPKLTQTPPTHFFPHSQRVLSHTRALTALTLTPGTHTSMHPPKGARRVPGVDTGIHPSPPSTLTHTLRPVSILGHSCSCTPIAQHTGLSSCRNPLPGPRALSLPDVQVPGRLRAPTPCWLSTLMGFTGLTPRSAGAVALGASPSSPVLWGHSLVSPPPSPHASPPPRTPLPGRALGHAHPEASQQSPGLSPPPCVCPSIAQQSPRPPGLGLGTRAALGAHPPKTHSALPLDWARGLRDSRGAQEEVSPVQL